MGDFFNTTLLALFKKMLEELGLPAVFLLLGMALFAFMPANMAAMKFLKARGLIILLNAASVCTISMRFYLPVLLWVLAFFLAAKGRRRIPKPDRMPAATPSLKPEEARVINRRRNHL